MSSLLTGGNEMIAINQPPEEPKSKGNGGAVHRSDPPDTQLSRRRRQVRPERTAVLYVSQDLRCWETNEPALYDRDIAIDGLPYRRLDLEYYAWLKFKLDWAMGAFNSGRIGTVLFDEISRRFSAVYVWARGWCGEAALRHAEAAFNAQNYSPPPTSTRSKHFPRRSRRGPAGNG